MNIRAERKNHYMKKYSERERERREVVKWGLPVHGGHRGNEREIREEPLTQRVRQAAECPTSQFSGEEEGLFISDNDSWAAHTTPLMC